MTLIDAKQIVRAIYPNAFLSCREIDGIASYIIWNNDSEYLLLAIINGIKGDTIPSSTYIELTWKQAAFKIMKNMLRKLES